MADFTLIIPTNTVALDDSRILATYVPAGRWLIRITQVTADGLTVAWALPVGDNDRPAFGIAVGRPRDRVTAIARRWRDSATATVDSDRVRWGGDR